MAKTKKSHKLLSNLVYYDSNTKIAYNDVGGNIAPYVRKLNNKARIVSTVPFEQLLKTSIEVPKTMDDVDVEGFITDTAYKQLKLPLDSHYEVAYFKAYAGFDADNWMYDAYLIEAKYLEKTYDEVASKTQFVDVITSVPFLPLTLYKTNRLDTISNHIFVFIEENNSSFAFYSKGEPVYIKSLASNIHKLRVEFNQESSLELNSLEFERFISNESPDTANYRTYIESMLNKIVREVDEGITYIKRVYAELDPTTIYFHMGIEHDPEFLAFFRDSFLLDTKSLRQTIFPSVKKNIFATAEASIIYADYALTHVGHNLPNLSHAKRPKPLSQRESGQFIQVAVGLFVLSLAYPVYNFGQSAFFHFRSTMLQTAYDTEVFPKAEQYRTDEASLKQQIETLQNNKKQIDEQVAALREDLNDIHAWQVGYIQKSKILNDILQVANNSKVRVIKATSISNNNQHLVIELNLFAKDQKEIADFVKILSEKGVYRSVFTDKVEKIALSDKDKESLAIDSQKPTQGEANPKDATKKGAATAAPQSISAKFELGQDDEISKAVSGHLNSIVKVIVR